MFHGLTFILFFIFMGKLSPHFWEVGLGIGEFFRIFLESDGLDES